MPDQPMLAPRQIGLSVADPDAGTAELSMTLSDSSYRYYAAFAFADLLAEYRQEFEPLLRMARGAAPQDRIEMLWASSGPEMG